MGIFNKLFGRKKNESPKEEPEHAVIIRFKYEMEDLGPLYDLEDELEEEINKQGVGEFDGHEIAIDLNDGFLYMYGPDAEALFKAVEPALRQTKFMKGAEVTLRFGPPSEGKKLIVKID